jgi:hypothetical protein
LPFDLAIAILMPFLFGVGEAQFFWIILFMLGKCLNLIVLFSSTEGAVKVTFFQQLEMWIMASPLSLPRKMLFY